MSTLPSTPSQTVGPYLGLLPPWDAAQFAVVADDPRGVWIRGRVTDGAGAPVPDGLVETWQVAPAVAPGFRGFARCETGPDGEYGVFTLVPVTGPDGQAPHVDVSVFARGLLHRVVTRVYFPEHADAHAADPVLAVVPAERRATLVAARDGSGYRFDVRLQGDGETVFFDV